MNSESIEMRKECVPWFEKLLALYRRLQFSSRLLALNGFYVLICNRLVLICNRLVFDLDPLIVLLTFLVGPRERRVWQVDIQLCTAVYLRPSSMPR